MDMVDVCHPLKRSLRGKFRSSRFLTCDGMPAKIVRARRLEYIVQLPTDLPRGKKVDQTEQLIPQRVHADFAHMLTHQDLCLTEILLTEILPAKGGRIISSAQQDRFPEQANGAHFLRQIAQRVSFEHNPTFHR